MGIDFPAAPTVGQKHPVPSIAGVPTYMWDGEKWAVAAAGVLGGKTPVYPDGSTAMTSQLTVVTTPVSPTDAASKTYVDAGDANSVQITAQTPTSAQQEQAYTNVYAAPLDAMSYSGMQINGDCGLSQENGTTQIYGGAGGTTVGKYICDGWGIYSVGAQSISWGQGSGAPGLCPGYASTAGSWANVANNSPGAGDYLNISQVIEGYRAARLGWGTAAAMPVSIGFWFASNTPGLHTVSIRNGNADRSYLATFNVVTATTWEWKTFTIPGCTTGTWDKTTGVGFTIAIILMCGTTYTAPSTNSWLNGNYLAAPGQVNETGGARVITGLIVVPGNELPSPSRAPMIMRPYTEELLICSRYFQFNRYAESGSFFAPYMCLWHIPVVNYRVTPTVSLTSSSFYCEIPWMAAINVTGGSVNNNQMAASGGDYLLTGTYSYTPAYNNSIAMMNNNAVKFDARF